MSQRSSAIAAAAGVSVATVTIAAAAALATTDVDRVAAQIAAVSPAAAATVQRMDEAIARLVISVVRQAISLVAIESTGTMQGIAVETIIDQAGNYLVDELGDYLIV